MEVKIPYENLTLPRKAYPLMSCLSGENKANIMKAKRGRYTLEFKQEGYGFGAADSKP